MGGATIGGIVGVLLGIVLIYSGLNKRGASDPSVTVTNDDGQSAPVTGESAKWILIILGLVVGIGGIVAIIKGASG